MAVPLLLLAGPALRTARADGDSVSPEEAERARQSLKRMEREVKESERQEKEQGAIARRRLATEFHVDASKLSDGEAILRLKDEIQARDAAKQQEEQRRREQAEAQREKQRQKVLDQQEAVAKKAYGMGTEEAAENEDAAQQNMYENMVKQGVAPQCRGKKGPALVECVDKALDAE
jgi:hypothetical protein